MTARRLGPQSVRRSARRSWAGPAIATEIRASGQYVAGLQLQPTTNATSVQVRNGKKLVTDGPFAETREQLGGFFIVEARELDDAIALAERLPSAVTGTIEIRPLVELLFCPRSKENGFAGFLLGSARFYKVRSKVPARFEPNEPLQQPRRTWQNPVELVEPCRTRCQCFPDRWDQVGPAR